MTSVKGWLACVVADLDVVAIGGGHGGSPSGAGLGQLSSPHQLQQAEALPVCHPKLLTVLTLHHTHMPACQKIYALARHQALAEQNQVKRFQQIYNMINLQRLSTGPGVTLSNTTKDTGLKVSVQDVATFQDLDCHCNS